MGIVTSETTEGDVAFVIATASHQRSGLETDESRIVGRHLRIVGSVALGAELVTKAGSARVGRPMASSLKFNSTALR